MCEFCNGKEGKTLLSISKNIAKWITYGGGYSSHKQTFKVKIFNNKLVIGTFPAEYTDSINDSIKINYCPQCGRDLRVINN